MPYHGKSINENQCPLRFRTSWSCKQWKLAQCLFWEFFCFASAGKFQATVNTCNWNNAIKHSSRFAIAITPKVMEKKEEKWRFAAH